MSVGNGQYAMGDMQWAIELIPMDAREGSPAGISIKSLSYIKMFSDSALKTRHAISCTELFLLKLHKTHLILLSLVP